MDGNTIIDARFDPRLPLRSMLQAAEPDDSCAVATSRLFKIRAADCLGSRSSASVLLDRMYAQRGYRSTPLPERQVPTRITLVASEADAVIGTITIGFDAEQGLHVDELFSAETGALRAAGRGICEFTKLAMDSVVRSRRVLASLFHVAYLYAHRIRGLDDLLIEVNPRHVRYYEQMLGFSAEGQPRHNPRVGAPAVLMRLQLARARSEIERLSGREPASASERSLYPQFFAAHEESAILARLIQDDAKALRGPARPARPAPLYIAPAPAFAH